METKNIRKKGKTIFLQNAPNKIQAAGFLIGSAANIKQTYFYFWPNLSFLFQFFIYEITASDAGPDIIRSHLFINEITASYTGPDIIRSHLLP